MSDNKTFSMPRVIFADERDESLIPPGVIMAIALQQAGYKIKPFVVGIDEHLTALLYVLFGEPATVLDSRLLENVHRLKQLFVTAAREDRLNILFASLGSCSEEKIKVNPVLASVAEQLKCPIIPVFFSSGSSATTARRVLEFARQLPNSVSNLINAVAFSSVLNPREYQLLEISVGRDLPWTALGYIPGFIFKQKPDFLSIVGQLSGNRSLLSLKTAAARLIAMERQIEWEVVVAHARGAAQLNVEMLEFDMSYRSDKRKVGVVHHPALTLGGDNNEKLLVALGYDVISLPYDEITNYSDLDFIYVPHGIGYVFMKDLVENRSLAKAFSSVLVKGKLLIEGGSSPIFGESFFLSNGDQIRGLSFFPFKGYYAESSGPCHRVNIEHISSEKGPGKSLSGYWPTWVKLEVKGFNCMPTWIVKQEGSQAPMEDGWVYGNASAFAVKPEFWSNPEIMPKMFS